MGAAPSTLASRGSRVSLTRTDLPEPGSCDAASVPCLPSLERSRHPGVDARLFVHLSTRTASLPYSVGRSFPGAGVLEFTADHGRPCPPGSRPAPGLWKPGPPVCFPAGLAVAVMEGREAPAVPAWRCWGSCGPASRPPRRHQSVPPGVLAPWARQCPLPDRRLGSHRNWGEHGQALGLYRPRSEP